MPSITSANRLRIFEEGNGSAIYSPTGLVACGGAGADGCLARYGETWAASHYWDPEEPRFAKLVQRLPAQKMLAAAVAEGKDAQKWDIKTFNEAELSLQGMLFRSSEPVRSFAANPEGTIVAVGVASGSITLVQTDDISVIKVLTAAHAGCVMSLAWNGSVLASSGLDGKIRTWDVATVETATALKTHTMSDTDSKILLNIESRQQHLAFSPDGKRLAVAGLPAVHVLDAATLQPMQELSRGAAPSSTLAWSPNSLYLAVGGCAEEEGALCKVHVWNTAKGTVVQDFDSASNISCLAFADNKNELAACDADGWLCRMEALDTAVHPSPIADVNFEEMVEEAALAAADTQATQDGDAAGASQATDTAAAGEKGADDETALNASFAEDDSDLSDEDGEKAPRTLRRKPLVEDEAAEGGDDEEGGGSPNRYARPAGRVNLLDELEARYVDGADENMQGGVLGGGVPARKKDAVNKPLKYLGSTLNGQETDSAGAQMPFNPCCIPAQSRGGSSVTQAALHYGSTARLLGRRAGDYTLLVVEGEEQTTNITAPRNTTMARLGPKGVFLACQAAPEEDAASSEFALVPGTVQYHPMGSWAESASDVWSASLRGGDSAAKRPSGALHGRRGEQPLCVAAGREWVAVATSWNALYVWRTSGILDGIVQLPGRPVTMAARGPLLAVVTLARDTGGSLPSALGGGGPSQSMQWNMFVCGDSRNTTLGAWDATTVCSLAQVSSGGTLGGLTGGHLGAPSSGPAGLGYATTPRSVAGGAVGMQPGALLRWAGISPQGLLLVQDSYGLLQAASPAHAWAWVPLLDTVRDVTLGGGKTETNKDSTPQTWHWVVEVTGGAMLSLPVFGGSIVPSVDTQRKLLNHTPLRLPMPKLSENVALEGSVSSGPVESGVLRKTSSAASGNALSDALRGAVLLGAQRWVLEVGVRMGTGPGGSTEATGEDADCSDIVEEGVGVSERERVLGDGLQAELAGDKLLLKVLRSAVANESKLAALHLGSMLRTLKATHASAQLAHKAAQQDVADRLFDLYKARREERQTTKDYGTQQAADEEGGAGGGAVAKRVDELQAIVEGLAIQSDIGEEEGKGRARKPASAIDEEALVAAVKGVLPAILDSPSRRGVKRALSSGQDDTEAQLEGDAGSPSTPKRSAVASPGGAPEASTPPRAGAGSSNAFNPFKRVAFTSPNAGREGDALKGLVAASPARTGLSPGSLKRSSSFAKEARRKHKHDVDA